MDTDRPLLALASLSGEADAAWARQADDLADLAFLGGLALDDESRAAARELVARDREEFLPEDPLAFADRQLSALADAPIQAGLNVRSATGEPIRKAAAVCADHDAVIEINAHCRQPELRAVGCGESLLADTDRLAEYVETAAATGATVSVKVRSEVPGVDLRETTRAVAESGVDAIHVDAMDSESVISEVATTAESLAETTEASGGGASAADGSATRPTVIANNEVRDRESVHEYLRYGADAVSVGRPSTDRRVLRRVREALVAWRGAQEESAGAVAEDAEVSP
ncbi:tRNA-dihydrouridine synthase [Salinirubrum litoreum]|uniref:tRNA-dihydrouridine synthase n=1 Tax=Salinirubrum litoreum TaxID=1126234 RepID=A0ABD5RBW5_9EURY|nr:tRNA-dihydrouridine synthase [Salinirubrum litoreum]